MAGTLAEGRLVQDPIDWLLQGDPSIRWQTLRDLVGASEHEVVAERSRVGEEGWGARLLALQGSDGIWPSPERHFLYLPYYSSTFYTLLLLRHLGLPASDARARRACEVLLNERLVHTGIAICPPDSETCQTAIGLSILAHFRYGDIVDMLAEHLLEQQMADGGWNCDLSAVGRKRERARRRPPKHASVVTTMAALEGLRAFEVAGGHGTAEAQARGREFLLEHLLFRSQRTGEVIDPNFMRLTFPAWGYDVLRALDHFQEVDAPRDRRLCEAVELVATARLPDGRWPLVSRWEGEDHFALEPLGAASRGITLRALRVLRWWDSAVR